MCDADPGRHSFCVAGVVRGVAQAQHFVTFWEIAGAQRVYFSIQNVSPGWDESGLRSGGCEMTIFCSKAESVQMGFFSSFFGFFDLTNTHPSLTKKCLISQHLTHMHTSAEAVSVQTSHMDHVLLESVQ